MHASGDKLAESLVQQITARRLQAPATIFLEAHKPLGFVASQFVLLCQPLLDAFVPRNTSSELVAMMQDRRRVEDLITRLTASDSGEAG